jgi:uncharacterized protein
MINRTLATKATDQLDKFPVIAIVGPRQSGKTTLAKTIAPKYSYYNLEDLSIKRLITDDPVGFIKNIQKPVILDEIQKFPELLSQIQVYVDESQNMGEFIITGSESLILSEKINQSLAGRVAINTLLPLSLEEISKTNYQENDTKLQILRGFYPRIFNTKQTYSDFYPEYITTYIEKDVRQIKNVGDLSQFEIFLQLLAGRTGQLLNLTSLSNDVGVSHSTIERWISLLEASYIVFRLRPYFVNQGKRLVKSPKIYFYDTGVLCSLLGIDSSQELFSHHAYGSIFENLIIAEAYKQIYNKKLSSKLYFYRDSNDLEIDLIIDQGSKLYGLEIKSSSTYSNKFIKNIDTLKALYPDSFAGGMVIYDGVPMSTSQYTLINPYDLNAMYDLMK